MVYRPGPRWAPREPTIHRTPVGTTFGSGPAESVPWLPWEGWAVMFTGLANGGLPRPTAADRLERNLAKTQDSAALLRNLLQPSSGLVPAKVGHRSAAAVPAVACPRASSSRTACPGSTRRLRSSMPLWPRRASRSQDLTEASTPSTCFPTNVAWRRSSSRNRARYDQWGT